MQIYIHLELLKSHPLFRSQGDRLREILNDLARQTLLDEMQRLEYFLMRLRNFEPMYFDFIQKNLEFLKRRFEELKEAQLKWNFQFLYYGGVGFPRSLYRMSDPPWTLMVWGGHLPWHVRPGIAVVGSREPSEDGIQWMEQNLSAFFRRQQVFSVSGGARGVDQRCHFLSIRTQTPTVVVLPSGLKSVYPSSILDYAADILNTGGCFISEYSYEAPMQKHLFHHRNRLIAALASTVLVVEARYKSGTMITAQLAAELGRPTLVVPGHPMDPRYAGSLQMIAEGGTMLRDAEDLSLIFELESSQEQQGVYL